MADTHNQAEIKTRYPVTDGIIAGTTTQEGHKMQLEPEGFNGITTIVRTIDRVGF